MNKDRQERREELLASRAKLLARMSERARQAVEQREQIGFRREGQKTANLDYADDADGCQMDPGAPLPDEIRRLIGEAHRLRRKAEEAGDVRSAMRGIDCALKALTLLARVTGEIREQDEGVTINVMATRDEGLRTAADLLMDLATAAELIATIKRLQQRVFELTPVPALPELDATTAAELSQSPLEQQRPTPVHSLPELSGDAQYEEAIDKMLFGTTPKSTVDDDVAGPEDPDRDQRGNG